MSLLDETVDYFDSSEELIKVSSDVALTEQQQKEIEDYLAVTKSDECKVACQQTALDDLKAKNTDVASDGFFDNEFTGQTDPKIARAIIWGIYESYKAEQKKQQSQKNNPKASPLETNHSLVEWAKVVITDLGLGFGWAAVYFTLFTLLWRGQTPGKKVMGIRVIALSGEYLNAWDSFGRYGGYGAGFATGLLGFMQIYWDPNRQAIQDKISATVVIKGDLPQIEVPFVSDKNIESEI